MSIFLRKSQSEEKCTPFACFFKMFGGVTVRQIILLFLTVCNIFLLFTFVAPNAGVLDVIIAVGHFWSPYLHYCSYDISASSTLAMAAHNVFPEADVETSKFMHAVLNNNTDEVKEILKTSPGIVTKQVTYHKYPTFSRINGYRALLLATDT